jgi:hypothetical protein
MATFGPASAMATSPNGIEYDPPPSSVRKKTTAAAMPRTPLNFFFIDTPPCKISRFANHIDNIIP